MKRLLFMFSICAALLLGWPPTATSAATILSGTAYFAFEEGLVASLSQLDAYFDNFGGAAPFTRDSGMVRFSDPIRGIHASTDTGRTRLVSTLDFDPNDVLGTWAPSGGNNNFVGNTPATLGAQIAFSNISRWTGPFTGTLTYGDFALRYAPSRANGTASGLVLVNNVSFKNSTFADLGNTQISISGNTLSITGDLLLAHAMAVLDTSATLGQKVGEFELRAVFAVPEPSAVALGCVGLAAFMGLASHECRTRRSR